MRKWVIPMVFLAVLSVILAACGSADPEVVEVEKEVVVEKEVIKEVEKPVVVEKEVIKEVPVEKVKVVEVIATREPEPTTMRVANLGPVEFLDRQKSQSVNDTFNTLMTNVLLEEDPTMQNPGPDLAFAWDLSEDGRTYTFKIRNDVTFHNGKKLTAGDIAYSWTRCRDEVGDRGRCKAELGRVESFSAPDDSTFIVTTQTLNPVFINTTAPNTAFATVDEETISVIDTAPNYTGPYRFRKLVPGDKAEYELYVDHYDKQRLRGKPDTFISIPIEEDLTRIAALKAGEVDLIMNVDFAHLEDIQDTSGLHLLSQAGGFTSSYLQIIFNYREGPTIDKAIREAVQYAIDKEAINKVVFNGFGEVGCHPLPKTHWAYIDIPCPERDPEKAKQILLDAGYTLPVELNWVPMFVPFSKVLAQVAKQSLAEGGINAEIEVLDTPTWFERVHYGVECSPDGPNCFGGLHKSFDAGDNWLARTPDPDGMITNVFKTNAGTIDSGFSGNNETRFYDPDLERLFAEGIATHNREVRIGIYEEIVRKIHFGEIPVIKLQTMPRFMGASVSVSDLFLNARGSPVLLGRWEFKP